MLLLLPLLGWGRAAHPARLAVSYTWTGQAGSSWAAAASWSPARTAPAPSDVLIFDGSTMPSAHVSVSVDFPATGETIQQLLLQNGVDATFITASNQTLTIDGNAAGNDFVIDAASALTLTTSADATGLTLSLTALETAGISGALTFTGASSSVKGQHLLLSAAANSNAVEFRAGSLFHTTAFFTAPGSDSPFGSANGSTGAASSVVFRNGANYEQGGDGAPFGMSAPASFVTFEPTSHYVFAGSTGQPALTGRTYGSLEYNATSNTINNSTGNSPLTIQRDLIVTQGGVGLKLNGGIIIGGDILVNGPNSSLALAPASSAALPIRLNGPAAQLIGGTAPAEAFSLGPNAVLEINTAADVTLQRPISLDRELRLTSGLLTTTATKVLTLTATATVSGGSGTSFVNGPVARPIGAVATATSFVFPVGKGSAYRPVTLNISTQSSPTVYRAEQFEGDPGQRLLSPDPSGTDLTRVSAIRYYTLTPFDPANPAVVAQPGNFTGTITLSFGSNDGVNAIGSLSGLVVAKRSDDTGPWANFGGSSTGTVGGGTTSGSVTSGTITSFSSFVLGSTNPATSINPLLVQLTHFAATRAANGVRVAWVTASQVNSARFVVERSLDGRTFEDVASVPAPGSTTHPHAYASLDRYAPAGRLYYRLRQVDADGTATYSTTAAVAATAGGPAELTLSPNPARESLRLVTERPTAYAVRTALGQPVLTGTTTAGPTAVAVAGLPPGIYFFELQAVTGRVVRRFVKE